MMGRQEEPERLFYRFNLERHVPANHLLRHIDAVLDLSAIRQTVAPYYAVGGRPSIDPELMIRMLLVGYAFAIRSERRLCDGRSGFFWFLNDNAVWSPTLATTHGNQKFFASFFQKRSPCLLRHASILRAARNALCGISTLPNWRMRFLPSFCFSRSLRLRLMSPP